MQPHKTAVYIYEAYEAFFLYWIDFHPGSNTKPYTLTLSMLICKYLLFVFTSKFLLKCLYRKAFLSHNITFFP